MLKNLSTVQILALTLVVLGAITGGTGQLTEIAGPGVTRVLVATASLATTIISGFIMVLTGQSSIVKSVQSMPGVETITVNAKANETLASLAVDPTNVKIQVAPEAQKIVEQTAAKG
jgi:hypothetical protein